MKPQILIHSATSPRVQYGLDRLAAALKTYRIDADTSLRPAARNDLKAEGFSIRASQNEIEIHSRDVSGSLYALLELTKRIHQSRQLPENLSFTDAPQFTLRGPCIGMQKTFILPGRKVYEYPYTRHLFPFFYDKNHWTEYLDFLADLRFNTLFLWNGHPFASLLRVPGYEYAVEVSDQELEENAAMFRWIAAEADRRGVWVVQNFYSLLLSKPFAERHGLETQLSASNDLADDYTRKSIAEFVRAFPNVGLMPCLGEALIGVENQARFLTQVILPGIHDGMALAGLKQEPPVVVRTHATDATRVMPEALKVYKNLYTEAKFNGESLTTFEPRGVRQQVHLAMSRLGSTHAINVHILANLEPFRYAAQRFIRKCVIAGRDRLGARGLHLYPLAYWDWPISPDHPPQKQIERDWMWFEAWARYAWNPDLDENDDREYWVGRLAEKFGDRRAAELILGAQNDAGECAPRILRRFGITEGNRQTMSLGMTLDQLTDPDNYRAYPELWESQSPPGERLREFVEKEWKGETHEGETPPQIVAEVLDFSARAQAAIERASGLVKANREEFDRIRNDINCIAAMSRNYASKVNAAILALRYRFSRDARDMEAARMHLAQSLKEFRTLESLTRGTYRYANTMQTGQRKIPVSGGSGERGANYHWSQLVPLYEAELADFTRRVDAIKAGRGETDESTISPLKGAKFDLHTPGAEKYEVQIGAVAFTDRDAVIRSIAPELRGLAGIRFSHRQAAAGHYQSIEFTVSEPVRVLVGYAKAAGEWMKVPDLETDASADDRGQAEPQLINAATIHGVPAIDVHAYSFDAGRNKLQMRGVGSFVVLGVIPPTASLPKRDARRTGGEEK